MAFAFGELIGAASVLAVLVALTSLVTAFTLQMATSESLTFTPSFGFVYKVSLQAGFVSLAICFVLGFVVGLAGKEFSIGGYAVLCAVTFFTNAAVLQAKLNRPEQGTAIGFGRACWLTTLQVFFSLMLAGAFIKLFEFMTK